MSKADRIKEALGWLKVVFAALVAVDVALIAWLAQNFQGAEERLGHIGAGCCGVHYWSNRWRQPCSVSSHLRAGESLMLWVVVAAVVVFIGGMLFVAYEASSAGRK